MNKQIRTITAAAAMLWLLLPMGSAFTQTVQVKTLSADYTNKKVTFSVSWAAGTRDDRHLSKVWVFVDYAAVIGANTLGAWQRADISSATTTAGTLSGHTGQGFFLEGAAGAFSATVTATLGSVPPQYNWCAFATDYPPTAVLNNGTYTLSGTPPFIINGTHTVSAFSYTGSGPVTAFTDATGREGIADPVITTSSPPICTGRSATLIAIASSGTTTSMTYTWNINGAEITTTVNTYTVSAVSVTTGMTYSVNVTNALGNISNTSESSITVINPATDGNYANACGCATGTINCGGYCTTNAGAPAGSCKWKTPNGYTFYISTVASEGQMNWNDANTYCKNKGMRLPSGSDLLHICWEKSSKPGGYLNSFYWTSTPYTWGYDMVGFERCSYSGNMVSSTEHVICI